MLCREVSSILDQLAQDSFRESLLKILALPLDDTNIMAIVCVVHERATDFPDLSEVYANLCHAIICSLPAETGLLEECQRCL
jgi:hypothetical protein